MSSEADDVPRCEDHQERETDTGLIVCDHCGFEYAPVAIFCSTPDTEES